MVELYTDLEPEYRNTRVRSGVPPPSSRDLNRQPRPPSDLSRYNPALQRQQQPQRYSPYGQPPDARRPEHHPYRQDPSLDLSRQNPYRQDHVQRHEGHRYERQDTHQRQDPYQRQDPHQRQDPYQRQDPHQRQDPYQRQDPHQRQDPYQRQEHHDRPDHPRQELNRPIDRPPVQARPPPPKFKTVDFRTSTDFLKSKNRVSLKLVEEMIQTKPSTSTIDYDFLSSTSLVEKVNKLRANIRDISKEQLSLAKSKSNPFEKVHHSIFMNRAATKLAALDATFNLTGTDRDEPFVFADVCGGPGGFSEYVLWRMYSGGGTAHGYGITLKAERDVEWRLHQSRASIPMDRFKGMEGDIYQAETIKAFSRSIEGGADLVMADGGFDFSGHQNQQEIMTQRLILCEMLTMFQCLKKGGNFVCKFFDIMSEGTAGLVWILYQVFDEVCINKPLSSRPANSERYLVCKGFLYSNPTNLIERLSSWVGFDHVNGIIPKSIIEQDEDFVDYLRMRNMKLTMKQTEALEQLDYFIKNPQIPSFYDQEQTKRQCLQEWRLPL